MNNNKKWTQKGRTQNTERKNNNQDAQKTQRTGSKTTRHIERKNNNR